MLTTDTYAERVEEAITAQDLRPIMETLTARGIPYTVEQTGGMCMAGFTELADGALIMWNSDTVLLHESAWAYAQDASPLRELYDLHPLTVAQTVVDMALSCVSQSAKTWGCMACGYVYTSDTARTCPLCDDGAQLMEDTYLEAVQHLQRTMDADTARKDAAIRAEVAHRIGGAYSLLEAIADNYGSITDNIPSAQDYADTIAIQYADMFPEDN